MPDLFLAVSPCRSGIHGIDDDADFFVSVNFPMHAYYYFHIIQHGGHFIFLSPFYLPIFFERA